MDRHRFEEMLHAPIAAISGSRATSLSMTVPTPMQTLGGSSATRAFSTRRQSTCKAEERVSVDRNETREGDCRGEHKERMLC
jgi:hypothetical protein